MVESGLAAWLLPLRKKKVRNNEFKFKQCSGAVPMDKNITVKVFTASVLCRVTNFIPDSYPGPRIGLILLRLSTLPDSNMRRLKKLTLDLRYFN